MIEAAAAIVQTLLQEAIKMEHDAEARDAILMAAEEHIATLRATLKFGPPA